LILANLFLLEIFLAGFVFVNVFKKRGENKKFILKIKNKFIGDKFIYIKKYILK